jgi:hypothetical protein
VVKGPVPGVALALQRGSDEHVPPMSTTPDAVTFALTVRVDIPGGDGAPQFCGPFTQGPPSARFVYLGVGQRAGQPSSPWDRRIKVPLAGITAGQVRAAIASGGVLTATFGGRGKDGTPVCATVRAVTWA